MSILHYRHTRGRRLGEREMGNRGRREGVDWEVRKTKKKRAKRQRQKRESKSGEGKKMGSRGGDRQQASVHSSWECTSRLPCLLFSWTLVFRGSCHHPFKCIAFLALGSSFSAFFWNLKVYFWNKINFFHEKGEGFGFFCLSILFMSMSISPLYFGADNLFYVSAERKFESQDG